MTELGAFQEILSVLHKQPVLTLFLIIGMGYLIGGIALGSFSLGPVAGVLFAGLFLGNFGFRIPPDAQAVGFALFIFSVGYQAGPRFFDVLRTDGLKYLSLALMVAACGFGTAVAMTNLFEFEAGTAAGLLAGGLTSSPTLAAAQEALRSGQVAPLAGLTAEEMVGNVATGYAITYIFGLAGLIAIIKFFPRLMNIDLEAEAKKLEGGESSSSNRVINFSARVYRVTNESVTKLTHTQLLEKYWDQTSVVRARRDGQVFEVTDDNPLQLGDELMALAPVEYFTSTLREIGDEVTPSEDPNQYTGSASVVVIKPDVVGKRLGELDIPRHYGVLLTGIQRLRTDIPCSNDTELHKGDVLSVIGPQEYVDLLGQDIGHVEREIAETDMVTFAFGIALGALLGMLSISLGQFSIGLGSAGGLLASGLCIGYLRSVFPIFGRMPSAARWILMEFGLLIFMAGVGLRAGGDIIETFVNAGPKLVVAGMMVTTIPVIAGYFFGRAVLKLNPVLLLGGITGSMTSGASLSVVTKTANSSVPSLGYTGAYAFANVILTIAGSLILLF